MRVTAQYFIKRFYVYLPSPQPLFKVSAQEKSLNVLSDMEIDKIKKERPGGYSETEVLTWLGPKVISGNPPKNLVSPIKINVIDRQIKVVSPLNFLPFLKL